MRLISALFATGAALVVAGLGCNRTQAPKPAAAPAPGGSLQGTVLEVLPATPYNYLRLKTATGEAWAAVPSSDVKAGAPVTVLVQLKMDKFESPSLHRTFDTVYMGTLAGAAQPAAPGAMAPAPPPAPEEKVEKAAAKDARTVAELYARRAELKDKAVTVRGKVVKFNAGIMGRNWLHLHDGSGTAASKDNDLAVTTKDTAKVGDLVTVTGPLHLDKDFGSGYTYPVILEDAKVGH